MPDSVYFYFINFQWRTEQKCRRGGDLKCRPLLYNYNCISI